MSGNGNGWTTWAFRALVTMILAIVVADRVRIGDRIQDVETAQAVADARIEILSDMYTTLVQEYGTVREQMGGVNATRFTEADGLRSEQKIEQRIRAYIDQRVRENHAGGGP